jgi:CRISPR/Cas system CSM-associated protein Csm4 (group 5 of RAMP superfamily)
MLNKYTNKKKTEKTTYLCEDKLKKWLKINEQLGPLIKMSSTKVHQAKTITAADIIRIYWSLWHIRGTI